MPLTRYTSRSLLAAASALLVAVLPLVGSMPAQAARPNVVPVKFCNFVSQATVTKVLGVKVDATQKQLTPTGAVCWFTIKGQQRAAYVAMLSKVTSKKFNADKALTKLKHQKPTNLAGFGSYPAYSNTISQAPYGNMYVVTVLKGSKELQVGSTVTSLGTVVNLTKKYLPGV